MTVRVGFGYDSHRLGEGDHIVIGGQTIDFYKGLVAHSDGDVLLHALCDALLGAAALGDIGKHFPDTDPQYKNIRSRTLVEQVMRLIKKNNYKVGNVDSTVILEKPKLAEHMQVIENNISHLLNISLENVNVKAKTNEGMGFIGREEGIAAMVVVTLLAEN